MFKKLILRYLIPLLIEILEKYAASEMNNLRAAKDPDDVKLLDNNAGQALRFANFLKNRM